MKTTYLIWKNPDGNGVSPEWRQITGMEFLALVRSLEGKNQYFITLPGIDDNDGAIVMEATEEKYQDWKREKNHSDYLRKCGKDTTVVSYHAMESEDGECYGEELLRDNDCDVETQCINTQGFEAAIASLTEPERRLVEYLYLSDNPGTVRSYAELTRISKSTVSRWNMAILEKLKKFF